MASALQSADTINKLHIICFTMFGELVNFSSTWQRRSRLLLSHLLTHDSGKQWKRCVTLSANNVDLSVKLSLFVKMYLRELWRNEFLLYNFSFIFIHSIFHIYSLEEPKLKHKFFNRSSSLKHASASKATIELQTPSQQTSHQQLSQQNSAATPKKSNWEVIEHFNTSSTKGGKAVVSSSLIAVSRLIEC